MNYQPLHLTYRLFLFPLITFQPWILFSLSFASLFFDKCFNNFFFVEVTKSVLWWYSFFYFFDQKVSLRPIWCVAFWKNVFVFWYPYMNTNYVAMLMLLCYYHCRYVPYSMYVPDLTPTHFILFYLEYVLLYFSIFLPSLSMHTFLILHSCACKSCSSRFW